MARLRADLAIGNVLDEDADIHDVTVAVLIGEGGVFWQSREAWGLGPGSALRGVDELEKLRGDIEAVFPEADIDWSVIDQVRADFDD